MLFKNGRQRPFTRVGRTDHDKFGNSSEQPISVSSEITVSRVPRTTLHCSSAPKKLGANSQVKHKRYADGSYANAPHPTELGHPRF